MAAQPLPDPSARALAEPRWGAPANPTAGMPGGGPSFHVQGKYRGFVRGLFLVIVTFGIYAWYWHYKAVNEIYHQAGRGTEFPVALYLLYFVPLIGWIFAIIYMSKFHDMLNMMRAGVGLPPTMSFTSYILWYTLGQLIIVGPFIAYAQLQGGINEVWRQVQGPR